MSDLQTISSKLWAMANELRGNMDAAEYKNYILAFMFYRYLSNYQEQYLVSNDVINVSEGQSANQAYLEQANEDDLSDYLEDISSYLGYAIAPHDTWESLIHKIDNSRRGFTFRCRVRYNNRYAGADHSYVNARLQFCGFDIYARTDCSISRTLALRQKRQ